MDTDATAPTAKPLSPEVVEMARRAVRDFHGCFWFRHPEADISAREDVEIIIDHLRRYGGHRAWQVSQQIRSCL